jgi:hypothetical protein
MTDLKETPHLNFAERSGRVKAEQPPTSARVAEAVATLVAQGEEARRPANRRKLEFAPSKVEIMRRTFASNTTILPSWRQMLPKVIPTGSPLLPHLK